MSFFQKLIFSLKNSRNCFKFQNFTHLNFKKFLIQFNCHQFLTKFSLFRTKIILIYRKKTKIYFNSLFKYSRKASFVWRYCVLYFSMCFSDLRSKSMMMTLVRKFVPLIDITWFFRIASVLKFDIKNIIFFKKNLSFC